MNLLELSQKEMEKRDEELRLDSLAREQKESKLIDFNLEKKLKELLPEEVNRRATFMPGENRANVDGLVFTLHRYDNHFSLYLLKECPRCRKNACASQLAINELADIAMEYYVDSRLCYYCQAAEEEQRKTSEGVKISYLTVAEQLEQLIRRIAREVLNPINTEDLS